MDNKNETRTQIGAGEFMQKTFTLSNEEFEREMLLDNGDDDIDGIEIIAQPMESYDRS